MYRIRFIALMATIVLLSACQEEHWEGDGDGRRNDLSFWWPNKYQTVYLECLNVPGVRTGMRKSFDPIQTGPDNTEVYLNYLYDYERRLHSAGCATTRTYTEYRMDGRWRYKYVIEKTTSRFRFRIGNDIGYIFSAQEKSCFRDPNQSPDLVQRAMDCNTNRSNDIEGLTKTSTTEHRCLTRADPSGLCEPPRLILD